MYHVAFNHMITCVQSGGFFLVATGAGEGPQHVPAEQRQGQLEGGVGVSIIHLPLTTLTSDPKAHFQRVISRLACHVSLPAPAFVFLFIMACCVLKVRQGTTCRM